MNGPIRKNTKLSKTIKFKERMVEISSITTHPLLVDMRVQTIDIEALVRDWSADYISIQLFTNPPICIEQTNGTYTAVQRINTLRIANLCFENGVKIPIQIVNDSHTNHLLNKELLIDPVLNYSHVSEIGHAYKRIKKDLGSETIGAFGSRLQSQEALATTLRLAKNTVFPPSTILPSEAAESLIPEKLNGEEAMLEEWISKNET